ncbi:MAG TPA: response regulator [Candidatus Limnocylindrales bacterium]|nr:response regulator [Candidatus Limnocylindrales bacterium]
MGNSKKSILIVEDEELVRLVLEKKLEQEGYHIVTVANGRGAIEKIRQTEFDLVLTDLKLQDITGLEVLEEVKKVFPDTIVVVLTGYGSMSSAIEAMSKGAYYYLNKPCSDEELKITIRRGLEKREAAQELKQKNLEILETNKKLEETLNQLRVTQNQLVQAEKMASLGQLLSGIAHEINNPLAGVMGYAQLLLKDPGLEEKVRQSLEKINKEANRINKIIQNLLLFTRGSKPIKRPLQINEVLESVLELRAASLAQNHIQVTKNLAPGLPEIQGDFYQLQQAFLNIIDNAEEALLKSQRQKNLYISSELISKLPPDEILLHLPLPFIRITLSDNGAGIPEAHLKKIFDPFFTSKEVGKGVGLGLSVSYGIIQVHGGKVDLISQVDQGTSFFVEIPLSQ